jgi:hypothetical protein
VAASELQAKLAELAPAAVIGTVPAELLLVAEVDRPTGVE